jgi:hypothetical protein
MCSSEVKWSTCEVPFTIVTGQSTHGCTVGSPPAAQPSRLHMMLNSGVLFTLKRGQRQFAEQERVKGYALYETPAKIGTPLSSNAASLTPRVRVDS